MSKQQVVDILQKISDSARGEFEEGSEKQMREALQSIHVAAEQALASEGQLLKAAKFALEILKDQAERFHKNCRCQLCESCIQELEKAINAAGDTRRQG